MHALFFGGQHSSSLRNELDRALEVLRLCCLSVDFALSTQFRQILLWRCAIFEASDESVCGAVMQFSGSDFVKIGECETAAGAA